MLVGLFLSVSATILWASNRGLNLTDEGYYLLSYADPQATSQTSTQFHLLVAAMTGPFEPGIVGYRIMRYVLLVGSSAFLGLAFHAFCHRNLPRLWPAMPPRGVTVLFIVIAGLLGYTWLPMSLSYNGLSATLLQVETGLVLWTLTIHRGGNLITRWTAVNTLLAGFLLSAHFFVKWPTAVILIGVLLITIVGVLGLRSGLALALVLLTGAAAGLTLLTEELLGGPFTIRGLLAGTRLTAEGGGHAPALLLRQYAAKTAASVATALESRPYRLLALVALLSSPVLAARLRCRPGVRAVVAWATAGAAGLIVLVDAWILARINGGYFRHGLQYGFVLSVLLALPFPAASALVGSGPFRRRAQGPRPDPGARPTVVVSFLFLALPLAAAFGTNNHPLLQAMTSASGFACLVLLTSAGVRGARPSDAAPPVLGAFALMLLAAVLATEIIYGTVVKPYALPTSLVEQSQPVEGIPRLAGLRVDPATRRFFTELYTLVSQRTAFQPGDPVMMLSPMGGHVYLLGGSAPGTAWLRFTAGGHVAACAQLAQAREVLAETNLLLLNTAITPEMTECLSDLWPPFPDDLVEVGVVANDHGPDVRVFVVP